MVTSTIERQSYNVTTYVSLFVASILSVPLTISQSVPSGCVTVEQVFQFYGVRHCFTITNGE